MREVFCNYIAATPDCNGAQGSSFAPLGGGLGSFKRLKMRWRLPGQGKSGGLRIGLSVNCSERHVVVSSIRSRRSAPSSDDFTLDFRESEGGVFERPPSSKTA